MVTQIEILLLAIVQGITEWLPVSSSGHLVIMQKILDLNLPLTYSILLHFGTTIVVITVFRNDLKAILKAFFKGNFETDEGKFTLYIAIGSVPIAVGGFFFYDFFKSLFSNLLVVGLALLITGCVLFLSEKKMGNRKMNVFDSLLIGFAQALTIVPGISRSGLTVATGLLRKIDKDIAFRYSFLLSVPAILGATLFEVKDFTMGNEDLVLLLLGTITSMIIGYASLKFLQKIVMNKKIHLFAYYCWAVGIIIILSIVIQ
jgi:undecaprenyl-diphosphatase